MLITVDPAYLDGKLKRNKQYYLFYNCFWALMADPALTASCLAWSWT